MSKTEHLITSLKAYILLDDINTKTVVELK